MEHRIGMEIRVLSKYMGRYLDDIHGIDCMLSGPQGLILIYLCENDEEVYQKDIEKYFNIRRSTATGLLNSLENKYSHPQRKTNQLSGFLLADYNFHKPCRPSNCLR